LQESWALTQSVDDSPELASSAAADMTPAFFVIMPIMPAPSAAPFFWLTFDWQLSYVVWQAA
jgi:hypothetical protein